MTTVRKARPVAPPPKMLGAIIRIATNEIGNAEVNGTNRGPKISKYFLADDYDPNGAKPGDDGYAWCAAFVCWVIWQAMLAVGLPETPGFRRPRSAGAWRFEEWCRKQDRTVILQKPAKDIGPGDIVVFTFSHIGIAVSVPDAKGNVHTIEGNTDGAGSREGGEVMRKVRHVSQIRSRIRFTV